MSEQLPETGDPVVDEVLGAFAATEHDPLEQRAAAAVEAQRRLQDRLAESAPGQDQAATAMQRVAGASPGR